MEQGRIAAAGAFGKVVVSNPASYPYGIYTIPEISFIGKTEEQLTDDDVPYEVGVAYYREIARGQIRGDTTGRLKLIFHRETKQVLGVHVIGEGASELLHIGQGSHDSGRHGGVFHRYRFQLPDIGRVLQGRRIQRAQQTGAALDACSEQNGGSAGTYPAKRHGPDNWNYHRRADCNRVGRRSHAAGQTACL